MELTEERRRAKAEQTKKLWTQKKYRDKTIKAQKKIGLRTYEQKVF